MKNKKIKNENVVTVCGALSPTGPGAKLDQKGGGNIYHVTHEKKKKQK
ncbi:MAG: hypothetical protein QG674_288 [Patescibacteria group bacterium]|jgi:hypothetical protein|nr:hypothetical protein [Patescibacteria group bacterium]